MLYLEAYHTRNHSKVTISERMEYTKENIVSDLVDFCKSGDDYINKEYIPAIADCLIENCELYSGWVALWDFCFGIYVK